MARQNINNGSSANDGTGDSLRQAAQKINQNFAELYQMFGGDSSALNTNMLFFGNYLAQIQGGNVGLLQWTTLSSTVSQILPDASGTITLNEATQILENKYLDDVRITGNIMDSAGNEVLGINYVASAVNHVGVLNAASGSGPKVQALGDDANINLQLQPKGSASVIIENSLAYATETLTSAGAISINTGTSALNTSGTPAFTLANGNTNGQIKKLINHHASGIATITPSSFAQGTSFDIKPNGVCELVWLSSPTKWFLNVDSDQYISITP